MKKSIFIIITLIMILSLTACTTRSQLAESSDTPEENLGTSIFDSEETTESITKFAQQHGMAVNHSLCYKSDSYYKLDTSRYSSEFELRKAYEDAVRDIVANGNLIEASRIGFFVESVLTKENGSFIIYIDYKYN